MSATPLDPHALRPHYAAFLRTDRILLTGHSHQAWPDVAKDAMARAFDDAARLVDDKWGPAMEQADAVREAVATRIGAHADEIALGASTHELVSRLLSALDLRARPRIVTTTGEFHSLRRQLGRLAEAGVEIVWVEAAPVATLAERLAAAIDDRTAALMASSVLFETSSVVPHLAHAIAAARKHGAEVLIDAYHAFGVVPFDVAAWGDDVFVTAGGYKYAQWGEGNCFLRVPRGSSLRPIYTGWFSDFAHLASARHGEPITYGARPADRFAGSTFDPVSHYRARAVADFFVQQGMSLERLRATSLRQTARLFASLDGLDVRTPREDDARGGFVAIRHPRAGELVEALRERGIYTDSRGDMLRLGPAPYVTDDELDAATRALHELAR